MSVRFRRPPPLADCRQHKGSEMPVVNVQIPVAWRHANEEGRIHYRIVKTDGSPRRLYVDEGSPLYQVLAEHLDAIGYEGPSDE